MNDAHFHSVFEKLWSNIFFCETILAETIIKMVKTRRMISQNVHIKIKTEVKKSKITGNLLLNQKKKAHFLQLKS